MKKRLAVVCVVLLLVPLVACAQMPESGTTASGGTGEGGEVTLRLAWWGNQERSDITMKIIEMYKEIAPNVTIEPEMSGWADYWTKLSTQAGASNLPDILQISDPYTAQYAARGQLANLDALMEQFDKSGVEDAVLNAGRIKGVTYMIPTGVNAMALVYDPAMYQQAGAMAPTANWTWKQFVQSAADLKEKLGVYGATQFESTSDLAWIQYLNSQGYELFAEDGNALGFDDKKPLVDFFTMEWEMTEAGVIPGPDLYGQRLAWEESFMAAGEAPSISVYANNLGYIQKLCEGRNLELGPPPAGPLGLGAASRISASMGFSIAENSENKEEAMKFLDFFTNSLAVQTLEMLERGIPISSTVRNEMLPQLDDVGKKVFAYIDMISASCEVAPPRAESATAVSTIYVEINEQVLFGALTPQQGAEEYMRRVAEVLA